MIPHVGYADSSEVNEHLNPSTAPHRIETVGWSAFRNVAKHPDFTVGYNHRSGKLKNYPVDLYFIIYLLFSCIFPPSLTPANPN
jgi:hypothetical protein